MSSIEEIRKAIADKRAIKAAPAKAAADEHEAKYLTALLAALDTYDEAELVTIDVPRVGKILLKFAGRPDHAKFTKDIHAAVEVSPCLAFSSKCVVWPPAKEFVELLSTKNPEGFVDCALAVKRAMSGKVVEEGKE